LKSKAGRVRIGSLKQNETIFELLIAPHFQSAYNYARWICGNKEEADDVFQEAMAKILTGLKSLTSKHVKPWIFSVVRNTYFDSLRRTKRRIHEEYSDSESTVNLDADTPETELLKKADHRLVQEALAKLPMEFREVLVLKEYEDMSYKEIAKVLDVPAGTVMSRLSRAREKLLQIIHEEERRTV
jgi:RNA polymerase sigma factor (sigma-70 family)